MLYAVVFFRALCVVEAVEGADEVAGYAADALELDAFADEFALLLHAILLAFG